MSSPTWTPDALWSERRRLTGTCRRLVEAQHRVSTLKLVDSLDEQAVLEELIEATKPAIPAECRHLHYLLSSPFRYGAPYPKGSRFRRAGRTLGVYYACERWDTAVAEMAFARLLFFADSPDTPWPTNPSEYTGFAARYASQHAIDLTRPPLSRDQALWTHPNDHGPCQTLAGSARAAGIEAIRTQSARDPAGGANLALLTCRLFTASTPFRQQTWRLRFGAMGVQALCAFPPARLAFDREAFARDDRVKNPSWDR